jgi:hypothetical protein
MIYGGDASQESARAIHRNYGRHFTTIQKMLTYNRTYESATHGYFDTMFEILQVHSSSEDNFPPLFAITRTHDRLS